MDISKIVPAATALREAARRLEAREMFYDWSTPASCNCGIVAQVVMGIDAGDLHSLLYEYKIGLWSSAVNPLSLKCPVTHLPMRHVIRALYESGLSLNDIHDLEHLNSDPVRVRAGLEIVDGVSDDFDNVHAVIRYMRALADIIDERGALPARTAREAELVGA